MKVTIIILASDIFLIKSLLHLTSVTFDLHENHHHTSSGILLITFGNLGAKFTIHLTSDDLDLNEGHHHHKPASAVLVLVVIEHCLTYLTTEVPRDPLFMKICLFVCFFSFSLCKYCQNLTILCGNSSKLPETKKETVRK